MDRDERNDERALISVAAADARSAVDDGGSTVSEGDAQQWEGRGGKTSASRAWWREWKGGREVDKEGRWKRRWEWSAAERKRLRRFQAMSGSPFACNDDADGRGHLKRVVLESNPNELRRQADDQPFFSFSAGSLESRRPIRAQASRV